MCDENDGEEALEEEIERRLKEKGQNAEWPN